MDLLRVVGALLGLRLQLDEARAQLVGARDELVDGRGHRALLQPLGRLEVDAEPSGSRSGSPVTTTP